MNREIKFRVWDKLLQEMNYIDLCDLAEGDDYWYDGETSIWEVMNDATSEQRRYVIQQYTGLKDKNGKEIYDGDLIRYKNGGIEEIDEVFFDKEYGTFEIAFNRNKSNSATLGFWIADLDEESSYEIIGNIYDRR